MSSPPEIPLSQRDITTAPAGQAAAAALTKAEAALGSSRSAAMSVRLVGHDFAVLVLIASRIYVVPPGDCGYLDREPACGHALAGGYTVGVSVDLGAGPQNQLPVVAVANFVEGEIDGSGDAVGRDRADRHPLRLGQADLLGAEGDVRVGGHIKVGRGPDVGVSPGITGFETWRRPARRALSR